MKTHKAVASLISAAQNELRCVYSRNEAEQTALRRRAQSGELLKVYDGIPSLYANTAYWDGLTPPERTLHIARALAQEHPQWVFGGLVAVSAYGFEHQWHLHDDCITIVTSDHGSRQCHQRLRHVYMPDMNNPKTHHEASGLSLISPARTLVEAAIDLDFRFALPIFDSALAKGITKEEIAADCVQWRIDYARVFRLLRYANERSENGGESLARGTIIEDRFLTPRIQVTVTDPQTNTEHRVDFVWKLDDGRVIVAEYDGTQKYVDPAMTDNRSIQEVVAKERARDEGLKRAGATEIVHFTYADVIERTPLRVKLIKAGVPQMEASAEQRVPRRDKPSSHGFTWIQPAKYANINRQAPAHAPPSLPRTINGPAFQPAALAIWACPEDRPNSVLGFTVSRQSWHIA